MLFSPSYRPVHVIELKRCWDKGSCFRDVERVLALLEACSNQKNGSLKHGYVAFLIVERAKTKRDAHEKIQAREENTALEVENEFFHLSDHAVRFHIHFGKVRCYPTSDEDEYAWVCKSCCSAFSNTSYIRRSALLA